MITVAASAGSCIMMAAKHVQKDAFGYGGDGCGFGFWNKRTLLMRGCFVSNQAR